MVNFGAVDPLMPHQVEGVKFLRDHRRAALFDEAGLGKSAQMLLAAKEPIVVVAPAMVLESGTWDDEIAKWTPGAHVTQVSYSTLAQRGPRGTVPRDALGFPKTPPKQEYVDAVRGGTLLLDESHYVKGRKTNWSVACEELAAYADRVDQATGTPIQNWADEAYMALRILHPEEAKAGGDFGSYWRWVKEWFTVSPSRWNPQAQEIGGLREDRSWEDFRTENWKDRMILRLRDEVMKDLPPLTWTGHQRSSDAHRMWRVKMTKEQARVYRELKRDFIAWLEGGQEVTAWSTPGLLVKLAKAATGLESLEEIPTTGDPAKGSGKLKVVQDLLEDRPRQTLLVAHFQSSVNAVARVAAHQGKRVGIVHGQRTPEQRKTAIRGFQRGDIDVLCASLGTISEGVTLHQGGADQVAFVERSWLPTKNEQALRRLHRIGQLRPVSAIDLVTEGTVEERVLDLLALKTDQQMQALGIDDYKELVK